MLGNTVSVVGKSVKRAEDRDPRPISVIDGMFNTSEQNEVISVSKTNM